MVWSILIVRLARAAPRHRLALRRHLRDVGAVSVSPDVWAVPATAAYDGPIKDAHALARRGSGDVLVLSTAGGQGPSEDTLRRAFEEQLTEQCASLVADCDRLDRTLVSPEDAGLAAHVESGHVTAAALRKRMSQLQQRNVTGLPVVDSAAARLRMSLAVSRNHLPVP